MTRTRFLLIAICALLLAPSVARAASFSLSPSSGSRAAGSTFTVSILLSSPGEPVNAVSGDLSFPPGKLQVVGLSKGGVVDMWVREPSYSNAAGTVSFEGVVFNPGYAGSGGAVLSVTFRAAGTGEARVAFSQAAILANDGQGTNVVGSLGAGLYAIAQAAPAPAPAPAATQPAKPAPTSAPAPAADALAPELVVKEVKSGDPTDPRPVLELLASDRQSGIGRLEVMLAGQPWEPVSLDADRTFRLPLLRPGAQRVLVAATDKAGNRAEREIFVYVKPLAAPRVERYRRGVGIGGSALSTLGGQWSGGPTVAGTSEPGRTIRVSFARAGEQVGVETVAGSDGRWEAAYPALGRGTWGMTAVVADERGAESEPTPALPVLVNSWSDALLARWDALLAVLLLALLAAYALRRRRRTPPGAPRRKLSFAQHIRPRRPASR